MNGVGRTIGGRVQAQAAVGPGACVDAHGAARWAVPRGVVEEVGDELVQARGMAADLLSRQPDILLEALSEGEAGHAVIRAALAIVETVVASTVWPLTWACWV